jgi:glycosyltransferase involved in cell wall biosynthesis
VKPPLAIFSPLPPVRAGTADYCFEQLAFFARDWDLAVVVERDSQGTPPVPAGVEVVGLKVWLGQRKRDRATPRLYHIGNNIYHEYCLEACLDRPGVVMLHDFVLHHLIVEMTLARGNERRYCEFMEHDYGGLGREVAEQRRAFLFTEYQQFLMPLNGRVAEAATGMIVHSRWAERRIRHRHPQLPVRRIPHHYSPPEPGGLAPSRAAARRTLGMPDDRLIFMAIGFVTPPKRIDLSIRALAAVRDRLPPFEFWLVGEVRDPQGLETLLERSGMSDVTRSTGYIPLERFQQAIQASDVIVNLRYPAAGESSGSLIRALGMGRPVVIFDYGAFADIPASIAMKIPLETQSTEHLQAALLRLGTNESLRRVMGEAAAQYVSEQYSLMRCTNAYTEFLREVLPHH